MIAACILGPDGTWSRDQAAIGGNMVRLHKLFSNLLDQTVQRRRETSFISARLVFETIVTVQFLIQEFSPELIESYVSHSLAHEKRLLNDINDNIKARDGLVLPIEDRMMKSIERAFASGKPSCVNVHVEQHADAKQVAFGGYSSMLTR